VSAAASLLRPVRRAATVPRGGLRRPVTFGPAPTLGRRRSDRSCFAGVGLIWFIAPASVPGLRRDRVRCGGAWPLC